MARNAHPEVTRTRILDAAQRLFMAQGYEHTSIQNIVDELGDLIPTEYPREAAELLSLLPNYWLMPYFYPVTLPEMEHRIRCLATTLDAIGVPFFDDELITVAAKGTMTFAGEPEKGSE